MFCGLLPTYLFRFAIPVPGLASGLPTTFLEILFAELFLVWLFTDGRNLENWRSYSGYAIPLLLFVLGASVSIFISPEPLAALGLWRAYILEPILFFPLFVSLINTDQKRGEAIAWLGALLAVIGVSAVIQKLTGFGISNPVWQAVATRRVTSFYGFPNAIGLFAAPVAVLLAGMALVTKNAWLRTSRILAAAMGVAANIFAVSEGALIGFLAGLTCLGLMMKKSRVVTLSAIIAACLAIMLIAPLRDYASAKLAFSDDGGSVRTVVWVESVRMLLAQPIFGTGLSGYPATFAPYHQADYIEIFQYPHNLILNFWSEVGLIGLAGFAWLLFIFFRNTYRLARRHVSVFALPALCAMVALLVHGLVDVPYFKNDLAFLFWIIVGLAPMITPNRPEPGIFTAKK